MEVDRQSNQACQVQRPARRKVGEEPTSTARRRCRLVVGEQGYAGASIALITQRAGLAQGTFYLYFDSREDLFDQLLPEVGQELLDFLGAYGSTARTTSSRSRNEHFALPSKSWPPIPVSIAS